jgi:glycosyltransferase involved in cell wall biosynthesis
MADLHSYYGVAKQFEILQVPRPQRRGGELVFSAAVAAQVLRRYRHVDLVYSRDLVGGAFAAELGLPTAYEAHGIFDERWQRALWRRMMNQRRFVGLIAISNAMVGELATLDLLPPDRPVIVAHSPANPPLDVGLRQAEISQTPRIGYIGSLYPGRGVELIVELAARMPAYEFELVGGTDADLERWRSRGTPRNVTLRGFVPPSRIPEISRSFDVLLMPYPHKGIHGPTQRRDTAKYCSPMKMFEYMASGVPMVASDLPVLQEVLEHERNALIAPYGDIDAWRVAIERLVTDQMLRKAIASQARADLERFTATARARRIVRELGIREATTDEPHLFGARIH